MTKWTDEMTDRQYNLAIALGCVVMLVYMVFGMRYITSSLCLCKWTIALIPLAWGMILVGFLSALGFGKLLVMRNKRRRK